MPRWPDWHEVVLFLVSGASVAALAVVSVSGPIDLSRIGLIVFGSLTAAVAAPMIESRIGAPVESSGEPRKGADPDADSLIGYEALQERPTRPGPVIGREAELTSLFGRLTRQQEANRR